VEAPAFTPGEDVTTPISTPDAVRPASCTTVEPILATPHGTVGSCSDDTVDVSSHRSGWTNATSSRACNDSTRASEKVPRTRRHGVWALRSIDRGAVSDTDEAATAPASESAPTM